MNTKYASPSKRILLPATPGRASRSLPAAALDAVRSFVLAFSLSPMKSHYLLGCALIVALGSCKPSPAQHAAASSPVIRVGANYWPGNFWIDIAHTRGWFKEAGLNVEWVDTNSDFFASLEDLASGKLDVAVFSFYDFVSFNARGKDLVGVIVCDYSSGADALVARRGIESVRELVGKKIALPKGTYLECLFSLAARRAGIDPGTVMIVDVPAEKVHEEFIAGRADAMFTCEPFVSDGVAKGNGTIIYSTKEVLGSEGGIGTVRRRFVEERPADLQRLLAVWNRATEFIKLHPEEAFAIVAAINKKSVEEVKAFAAHDRILDARENRVAFTFAAGLESLHGSLRRISEYNIQRGLTARKVESVDVLDDRFLRGLEARP